MPKRLWMNVRCATWSEEPNAANHFHLDGIAVIFPRRRCRGRYRRIRYNSRMTNGRATPAGTARYRSRFAAEFYRDAQGLSVSTLGLGTYLCGTDSATDDAYAGAVAAAVCGGINFLDSAINYRHQRSERSIGTALSELFA